LEETLPEKNMQITINNKTIDFKSPLPDTWGTLLALLLKEHVPSDHGITEILLNGKENREILTTDQDLTIPRDTQNIQITTKDAVSITEEGFEKIASLLEHLGREIQTVEGTGSGPSQLPVTRKIMSILEAIRPIANFINSVGMNFSLDYSRIPFNKKHSIRDKIDRFITLLDDFTGLSREKDMATMIRFVKGPLKKEMADWEKLCRIIMEHITASRKR